MKKSYYFITIAALLLTSMTSCEKEDQVEDNLVSILDENYRGDIDIVDLVTMSDSDKTYPILEVLQDKELFEVYKNAFGMVEYQNDKGEIVAQLYDEDETASKRSKKSLAEFLRDDMLSKTGSTTKDPQDAFVMVIGHYDANANGGFAGKWKKRGDVWRHTVRTNTSNYSRSANDRITSLTMMGQVGRESGQVRITLYKDYNQRGGVKEYWIDGGGGYQIYREVGFVCCGFNDKISSLRTIFYGGN